MAISSSMSADADETDIDPTDEFLEGDPISIEQQAMAMGWHPLPEDPRHPQPHEYRGDPRRHSTAEEFVRKGLEELPVLRNSSHRMASKLTRMGDEIGRLRDTVTEQAKTVQDAIRMARSASQAGYERALKELKDKQRTAAHDGDAVVFDDISERINAMETERASATVPEPTPPAEAPAAGPAKLHPEVVAFTRDPSNRWFFDSAKPYLKQSMIQLHQAVLNEGDIDDVGEQLVEARTRLVEMYPQDFTTARRPAPPEPDDEQEFEEEPTVAARPPPRRAAPVAAPSRAPITPGRRARSPFEAIDDPGERSQANAAFERMRSMDPGLTATEYMELYTNPHADALALRSKRKA